MSESIIGRQEGSPALQSSRSVNLGSLLLSLLFVMGTASCDRLQKPSKVECEEAAAQVFRLAGSSDKQAASGPGILDKVKAEAQLLKAHLSGEYEAKLAVCQRRWNRHRTNCLRLARSVGEADSCGPL